MKLTNDQLVQTVNQMQEEGKTKPEICRACGYSSIKEDGTERLHFTDFYTALIEAKGLNIPKVKEESDNELYNKLCEEFPEEAVDAFIELYSEEDLEYFRDAYYGEYDSEEQFAESFYDDMGYEIPEGIVVDWEGTWNYYLRHSYIFTDGFVFCSDW